MNKSYEQAAAWLLENDLIQDPLVMNGIISQTLLRVPTVSDMEAVVDTNNRKILIYLSPNYKKRRFFQKKGAFEDIIISQVSDIINSILPKWRIRVVLDRNLLLKALKIINGDK
jgi:hypothetical protein